MKLREYRVTWEIDVDARGVRDAAERALAIQRDPVSLATVFTVRVPGGTLAARVDLAGVVGDRVLLRRRRRRP